MGTHGERVGPRPFAGAVPVKERVSYKCSAMKKRIQYPGLQLLLCLLCLTAAAQQPTLEWVNRYAGMDSVSSGAASVAVDAAGNSYVTGSSRRWPAEWMTTIKYSPSGAQLWAVEFKDLPNTSATAIAVDNRGGLRHRHRLLRLRYCPLRGRHRRADCLGSRSPSPRQTS